MPRHFIVATFQRSADVLHAVRRVRGEHFRIYDVYSPFPIHGLDHAMGIRKSRLPLISLVAAASGLLAAAALQYYTTVLDWPMNVGGKPDDSTLAFVPISFELTVLFCGLVTVAALFLRAQLFPGKAGRLVAEGVTNGRFAIAVRKRSTFDAARVKLLFEECGAEGVAERAVGS